MEHWSTSNYIENVKAWYNCPFVPLELRDVKLFPGNEELALPLMEGESETWPAALRESVEDAFLAPLHFGTAGLRGKMGIGLNRMNVYTVAMATQGVANWLRDRYSAEDCRERGVVIGYDTRHHSELFARVAATVLAANHIHAHLFPSYCQTPLLAYSIRPQTALAGIMVTASHNPAIYNGYKLYGEDGIQIGAEEAEHIARAMQANYEAMVFEEGFAEQKISFLPTSIFQDYISKVIHLLKPAQRPEQVCIAYSPMHGTGAKVVLPLLRTGGFTQVHSVASQVEPDPDFPTAPAPNPENPAVLEQLIQLATEEDADLALATDPDADRLALVLKTGEGRYRPMTGNETGLLLAHYWLHYLKDMRELPENAAIVKSIVTDNQARRMAEDLGVHTEEALTGFKDICGCIRKFEEEGSYHYVMGYEESIGYAVGDLVLDKDGCSAAYLLCHAAAEYKERGTSLWEVFCELQERCGYWASESLNLVREGRQGMELFAEIMGAYRMEAPLSLAGIPLVAFEDYQSGSLGHLGQDGSTRTRQVSGKLKLRSSNVLRYFLEDGSWYALRPSGTEPKLKAYFYATGPTEAVARAKAEAMRSEILLDIEAKEAQFKAK